MSIRLRSGLLLLMCLSGCSGNEPAPMPAAPYQEFSAPTPVATTIDGTPEISIATLRRELGANSEAQFDKAGGKIIAANLMHSGVTKLGPLKGLPLKYLDLTGQAVADLSPLEGMPLEQLYLEGTEVTELSPLRGMPLEILRMEQVAVSDLSPLAGMRLTQLNLFNTLVTDISVIQGMPLETLWLTGSKVQQIDVLKEIPLVSLDIENTDIADLTPLSGKTSLKRLNIAQSKVTDLTPLAGLALERLIFTPEQITSGLTVVREMPTLQQLGRSFEDVVAAPEFWAAWDARQ